MIVRTTAIPLSIHPYSSTSRVVHWLTRNQGKISTLLKGALRTKSPFLGEYDLFSTSELLYFSKPGQTLYTAKECALLDRRDGFRTDWRAMQTASYITYLFNAITPTDAPQPGLFEFFEEMLDFTEEFGRHPQFMLWAELHFSKQQGHTPHLTDCVSCGTRETPRFCASQGGVVCAKCAKSHDWPTLPSPPDVLAVLRAWQRAEHPSTVIKARLTAPQRTALNAIVATFMAYHFNLQSEPRNAALIAA